MQAPLKAAGIEWEGWHAFRRGLATNLERIGGREAIAAMILRHSNDRVTRKHYSKPLSVEAVSAMQRLLRDPFYTLTAPIAPQLLQKSQQRLRATPKLVGCSERKGAANAYD